MKKLSGDRLYALKNEIPMAQAFNTEELEPIVAESISRYTGRYVPQFGINWDVMLNEVYPIIQHQLPSIFFRNPRAFLKPRNKTFIARRRDPISGQMVDVQLDSAKSARTQEHLLNYTISQIGYKPETRKVLLDALLFPHGVLWHGYKGDFGMTEEQSIVINDEQVFVSRISPLRFLFDPSVTISRINEAKWVGRVIDIPFIDLVEDEALDVDKELIKGFQGYGKDFNKKSGKSVLVDSNGIDKRAAIDFADEDFKNSKAAKFVRVFEIYLRPTKKEKREGSKGHILLLTDEQEKPLRDNEWSIKAEGWPAKILMFNDIPDAVAGLADIDTYKSIADQKNIITNLQIRNAQETTKTWVGIAADDGEEQVKKVQAGENTILIYPPDTKPGDKMFVASPSGGQSSELYLIDQRIQRNLEDKSGVSDLKKGFLQSGEESATSVKIRNAGGSARASYRQDIMADFIKESYLYINQLIKQFFPYDKAVRVTGSLDIEWSEDPSKEEVQADVDVEINAISMLPENPEQEMQQYMSVLSLIIQALSTPPIAQKITQEGKTFNLSPLIEQILIRQKINNSDVFRNLEPGESMGYSSNEQLKEAQANVGAAIQGQQLPFPPNPKDDHGAKLEVYASAQQLLQISGQVSDALNQLIQIHQAFIAEIQKKEDRAGSQVQLKPFKGVSV